MLSTGMDPADLYFYFLKTQKRKHGTGGTAEDKSGVQWQKTIK